MVAPEKGNERAQLAMSALARAMAAASKRAIVRYLPRAKGAVQLGLLSPCLAEEAEATSDQPDCLWLNILPFTEDVRSATFSSFQDQNKRLPTATQVDAMRAVVASMLQAPGTIHIAAAIAAAATSWDTTA